MHDAAGSTDKLVPATISVSQFEISRARPRHKPVIRWLTVKRDFRTHDIAAVRAMRHAGRVHHKIQPKSPAAAHAEILIDAAMQFKHVAASGFLVQAVDILCDDGRHLARAFISASLM